VTNLVYPVHTGTLAIISDLRAFTDTWLANRELSRQTRIAYRRDVNHFLSWCHESGLDPLTAKFTHVNAYGRHLEDVRGFARRSRARALSSLSSWYGFLLKLEAVTANPAADADRPRIDRMETKTIGFTAGDAARLVDAAKNDRRLGGPCALAVIMFMVDIGARVSEVCAIDLADLSYDTGHRTVLLRMKGGKTRRRAIPPSLGYVLDMYLAARAEAAFAGAGR
jgi:site-specific recombinase XerD